MRISILDVALFLVTTTCDLTKTDLLADENREKPRKAVEASVEMERGDFSSSAPDPASTRRDKPIANPGFNVRPVSLLPVVGEEGHLVDAQLTEESNRQPSPAKASVSTFSNSSRQGTACLRVGVGFTLDPETFLSAFEGNYFVHNNVAVGPLVQVGVSGNRLILGTTVNVKGVFDLPNHDLARLKPFAQGGLGFAYLEKDKRRGDDDDVGFLLNFGGGADYYLTDRLSLGSHVLFNFMPDKVLGRNFFFSWQLVSASFHF